MPTPINSRGQVVGFSDTTPVAVHFGYVNYSAAGQVMKGAWPAPAPSPYGLGGSGLIPAHIGDRFEFDHHAFLYNAEDGRMQDLSRLPEVLAAGWSSLNYAYGINEHGQIVGSGTIGGAFHAFLLTPLPK